MLLKFYFLQRLQNGCSFASAWIKTHSTYDANFFIYNYIALTTIANGNPYGFGKECGLDTFFSKNYDMRFILLFQISITKKLIIYFIYHVSLLYKADCAINILHGTFPQLLAYPVKQGFPIEYDAQMATLFEFSSVVLGFAGCGTWNNVTH